MLKKIIICAAAAFLSGCVTETPEQRAARLEAEKRDHAAYLAEHVCNFDAAYAAGMNDGKHYRDMQHNFASECGDDAHAYNKQYASGYRFGYKHAQAVTEKDEPQGKPYMCISDMHSNKICGFDCKKSFGAVACAPDQYGNCIEDFGKVICGRNCRKEYGKVVCDPAPPQPFIPPGQESNSPTQQSIRAIQNLPE